MILCKQFPDKEFASKEEVFTELRKNAAKIITLKKAQIQKSYLKGNAFNGFLIDLKDDAAKVGPQMKDGFIYPVINTTNYMDSHDDCHFPGIWKRTVNDQAGKIYYVTNHDLEIGDIIAWPEDVNMMVKTVPWSFVGKDYQGSTEALIYEIDKAKITNEDALDIIDKKRPVQNSVRMQYVTIKLAMNSENKDDITYKTYWDARIDEIANKDVAIEQGYFFGVEEAKIICEGSMVIKGSNDATPIRQKDEAGTTTSEHKEPANPATQPVTKFYHDLI